MARAVSSRFQCKGRISDYTVILYAYVYIIRPWFPVPLLHVLWKQKYCAPLFWVIKLSVKSTIHFCRSVNIIVVCCFHVETVTPVCDMYFLHFSFKRRTHNLLPAGHVHHKSHGADHEVVLCHVSSQATFAAHTHGLAWQCCRLRHCHACILCRMASRHALFFRHTLYYFLIA